ncbi:MEGF8 (predicted) [Pycnogonum litorale]
MNVNQVPGRLFGSSLFKVIFAVQLFVQVGKNNVHGVFGSVVSDSCNRQRKIHTHPYGIISDGMQEYPMDTHCEWLIKANSTKQFVTLKFLEMVTECSYDHLFIYDGDSYNDTLLGSFSGSTLPPLVTASSGYMLILLFSDTNYVRDGFVAEYYVTDCPLNCSNGVCINHVCKCKPLWSGSDCGVNLCPDNCGENEGRGKCQTLADPPHCLCNEGYSGQSCMLPSSNRGKNGNKWYIIADENRGLSGRAGHAGVYLKSTDRFYVFGGYNLNTAYGDLVAYDFKDNFWHNLTVGQNSSGPAARYGHAMSEYAGNLVVFGGTGKDVQLNDLWLYNTAKNKWTKEAVQSKIHPPALSKHTLTLVDDDWIYVFGGHLADGAFSSELYKINLNSEAQWHNVEVIGGKALNRRLVGHTAVFDERSRSLLVYGGISVDSARFSKLSNRMHSFQVDISYWTEIHFNKVSDPKKGHDDWMPMERAFHTSVIVGDYMVVYGGYSHRHSKQEICYDDKLYFYHLYCHTWINYSNFKKTFPENKNPIPRGAFSHASAVRNGTTVLLSGGYSGSVRGGLFAYSVPETVASAPHKPVVNRCLSFRDELSCRASPECDWCTSSSKCLNRQLAKSCDHPLLFKSCPGLCQTLKDCQSCLIYGHHSDTNNISQFETLNHCSWCVQSGKCSSHNEDEHCWVSKDGVSGWWGNNSTTITEIQNCRLKDFRPGLTWLRYRSPMNISQPDEVSVVQKTAQIFAFAAVFSKEVDAGGYYTSRFLGFIHPMDAKPKVESILIVFMGSSEASSTLKMSINESSDFAELVANHSASTHYRRTPAHRPNDKTSIFPNPSVGHKYFIDFEARQSIVKSMKYGINASMQLEWNGFKLYRDVFHVEFLEPYHDGNCNSYTNCLQCLADSSCGWNDLSKNCLHRLKVTEYETNDEKKSVTNKYLTLEPSQCDVCPDYIYCEDCLKASNCEWLIEEAVCVRGGRFADAVRKSTNCPQACHKRNSCSSCLGSPGRCAWCEQAQSCFLFSTYTTYFQYGACREWVDEDHVVLNRYTNESYPSAAQCRDCGSHKSCKSCIEDLSCGWCGNRRNPTVGSCVRGDFEHPYEGICSSLVAKIHNVTDSEPADWSYSHCPDVNECELGLHNCHPNASCFNTFESYSCICKRGFKGNGIQNCDRMCYEDCLHGFCSEAPDYKCICELGWTGAACDIDCGCHNHSTCESGVGTCDKCQEWTEGSACERCLQGSYGDATSEIGCRPCECNDHGNITAGICNRSTGVCFCQDQTESDKCDRCKTSYYGNPKNSGRCYKTCEPRAIITNLKSGSLGSHITIKPKMSCLWILSVFDEFDTNNLVLNRKLRSVGLSASIWLNIDSNLSVPCDRNKVYVYDGFPDFMIGQSHQNSYGKLLGTFCKRSGNRNINVEATSGFMTIYYEQSSQFHGFNATFSILQCRGNCGENMQCVDGACVCPPGKYGYKCQKERCPANCNRSRDKVGRLVSFCNEELGHCICKDGYGGDDCSVGLQNNEIVWKTLFDPESVEIDLKRPSKSIPRMGHSLHAISDGHLLMFGGYSLSGGVKNDLYLLNVDKNNWHKIVETGNKPSPRYFHGSSYVPSTNKLYIYGGLDKHEVFGDFWMFDVNHNTWTQLQGKDLPPLAGHTLTNINDERLILIGGFSPQHGFNEDMYVYDLERDIWSVESVSGAIPVGLYGHSAVYHAKSKAIYVFGGYLYKVDKTVVSNELHALQDDNKRWTRLPFDNKVTSESERPTARYFHIAETNDDYMVILGGTDGVDAGNIIAYNYKCNMWVPLDQPGIVNIGIPVDKVFGMASTYANGSIFLYGGFDGAMQEKLVELQIPADLCAIHSYSRFSCLTHRGCSYCSVFQKDGTNHTFCYNADKDPPRVCYAPSGATERSEGYSCNVQWLNERSCYQYTTCSECLAEWPAYKNASNVCQWCTNCQVGRCIKAGNICEEENNCNLQQRVTKNSTQCPERLCPASDCEKCDKKQKCMWTRHVLRSSELGRTLNQMPIYNWTCVRKIIQDASNFPIVSMPPLPCPSRCHQHDSCETCLSIAGGEGGWHSCSWSPALNKCMTPSFQPMRCAFGECGLISLGSDSKALKQCSPQCYEYQQSQTCLSQPTCGWCSFSGKKVDGQGLCMNGGLFGPISETCSFAGLKKIPDDRFSANVTEWIGLSDGPPLWSYLRSPPENECLNGHHDCDAKREECIDTLRSFECKCRPGYLPAADGTCRPVCSQGCINGTCTEPGVCRCLFGYVGNNCSTQCQCNGHSNCAGPNHLDSCLECHNSTQGSQCETCKPFYVGNPKKHIKCISCKVFCNGHSDLCLSTEFFNMSSVMLSSINLQAGVLLHSLDMSEVKNMVNAGPESEAVCLMCEDNTEGDRCEQCEPGYFRIGDSTRDGCRPCQCHGHSDICDPTNGENCKCQNHTETDPQCNPKTSKNSLQPCWKLQCSKCKEYFLGNPTNGHQCYRHMFVEKDYCFDPYTQDECSRKPSPLGQGRTVFFAVQPKYMNVDIRIVVDVSEGGVDFFFSAKEDTFVVDVNKSTGVHFASIDEKYGLEIGENDALDDGIFRRKHLNRDGGDVVKRSIKLKLDDESNVNVTERFKEHSLKEIEAGKVLNKFVRIENPREFIVIRNLRDRLVITVPLEVHDLRSTRFYMVLRGVGAGSQNLTYGSMFFRQDQPRIDLFVFFSVFFSCFFLFLAICVVMWKFKQLLDQRHAQQRHAEEMKHMASRPFAKLSIIIDDSDPDDVDFMVPPSMYSSPTHPSNHHHHHHHKKGRNKHLVYTQTTRDPSPKIPLLPVEEKFGIRAISVEPTYDGLAAVGTVFVQLPGGNSAPVRLSVGSSLVVMRVFPNNAGGGNGIRTYIRRRTSHLNV